MMLTDRGVAVLDVPPGSSSDIGLHAHELRRAIAERATFGVWCDALAWHDVVDPLVTFRAVYGNKGQRVPRRAPSRRHLEQCQGRRRRRAEGC